MNPLAARWRLRRDGFVVLRNFLRVDDAAALRAIVVEVFATLTAAAAIDNPDMADQFRRCNCVWLDPLPEFLAVTDAALGRRYAEIAAKITAQTRTALGRYWRPFPLRSFMRQMTPDTTPLPWHTDAEAAQINRDRCVNVWLPLDRVGDAMPTIELRGRRQIAPPLERGDALVFDQFTPHRTQPAAFEGTRLSCEMRFFWPPPIDRLKEWGVSLVDRRIE